jgi:hypothetical protein
MANELKKLEPGTQYFDCAGKKYFLSDKLSFIKFEKLSEWTLEFGFSATFKDIFTQLRKQYDLLNQMKLADAIVVCHNLMSGIVNLEQKNNVAFRICALFILEEGENEIEYNEAKIDEKIDNWSKEYDAGFFLNFAASIVPNWIAAYNLVSQNTSEKESQKPKNNISTK